MPTFAVADKGASGISRHNLCGGNYSPPQAPITHAMPLLKHVPYKLTLQT